MPQYSLPFHKDPLEPANRIFFGVSSALIVGVAEPVSSGWRQVVPQDVRTPLVRAANNIEYPRRGLNNLLQGKTKEAGDETARFAINTTAGVLGLMDVAAENGIQPAPTDTGMTLKKAGWEDSVYLTLPFGMPGTVRDVVGGVGDTLLDPTIYFFPAAPIKGFIQGAERMDAVERFVTTNPDPYEMSRRLYLAQRQGTVAASSERSRSGPALETLAYAMLAPRDAGFDLRGRTHRVRIAATDRRLPYDVWMQKTPAPLVLLLPGFGGHRESYANMATAEMLFNAGYSVATISSAANFEFMRRAATITYPGFAPADAADVRRAVSAVCRDIESRDGDLVTKRALVGVSFGGVHSLFIAASPPRDDAVAFDAYLAICPPIQFEYAAQMLDDYYNLPLSFPEAERDARVAGIIKSGALLTAAGPGASAGIELSEEAAEFLVGLAYRVSLHDTIWTSRQRHDSGILKTDWNALTRASASQEILEYSMMKYAYAFLLPELQKAPAVIDDAEALLEYSDLRRLTMRLRTLANVGVAFNENDFLLAPGDSTWLRNVFGDDRLANSPDGGHIGNLGEDAWRTEIVELLKRLLDSEVPASNVGSMTQPT
ncbi:MAG: alpha/beta fold hydrolase [Phycisphaerales bacterium]|nr:alpha/beta fold hydrolase [Phycisphaerales bacterium]MCB9861973.1 alpha/beta fold hydrolase [Phycisphaerales bacterium]